MGMDIHITDDIEVQDQTY